MRDIDSLLATLAERQGSDLHLKVGSPPLMRFDGVLGRVDGEEPLRPEETEAMAHHLMSEDRWRDFLQRNEADLAYSIAGVARFRVNVFRQRGSVSVVLRLVRVGSPSFDELGLPPVVRELADEPRGLVLVTGPTGSGKTTTLSAMIDHINAMRAAMRQDPDVILIGEMRDTETVQAALAAAETGHLVLSTLHTIDATETVNRIVDFFPPFQQQQVRVTLAGALKGVVCQRLVPRAGGGRVPALEVCVNTGRVAERIIDSSKTYEIEEVVADGSFYGMQTFDKALVNLVTDGTITVEDALEAATNRHDFELALQQAGVAVPA